MSPKVLSAEQVHASLADLCRGDTPGRRDETEITLFKSVGCALGDLCDALAVWKVCG